MIATLDKDLIDQVLNVLTINNKSFMGKVQ
jgi:hypothetical protein